MNNEPMPAQGPVEVNVRPIAWTVFSDNGNIRIWSSASEPVRKLADDEGMKLVPLYAIPEGWELVPKQPTPVLAESTKNIKCAKCSNQYTPRPGFAQCQNCGA